MRQQKHWYLRCGCFCSQCGSRNVGTAGYGCFCSQCGSRNIGTAGCGCFCSQWGSRNIGTAGCGWNTHSQCGSRNITAGCGASRPLALVVRWFSCAVLGCLVSSAPCCTSWATPSGSGTSTRALTAKTSSGCIRNGYGWGKSSTSRLSRGATWTTWTCPMTSAPSCTTAPRWVLECDSA